MPEGLPLRPGDPERLGAYRLVGRLGEGSQGVVYLGRDASGGPVAIKLLQARMADHPRARERFVQELSAAKKVARFCTAQVLDADVAGDRPYIVSEYVEGRSLRSQILEEGPRRGGALERLATSTLTALAAIHKAGVIHRDFTPHNVLIGPDGPRVIDFGIARALDGARHDESGSVGTPAYMAPEQVSGGETGPPADLFAWAGTILFAATGRPPFGNESVRAVMDRVLHAEADVTPLPEPLRGVVTRCLSKDPAERPTAQQAHAALLGQDPVSSGPPLDVTAAGPDPVEPKEPPPASWSAPGGRTGLAGHLPPPGAEGGFPPPGHGGAAGPVFPAGPDRPPVPDATPVIGEFADKPGPAGGGPGDGPAGESAHRPHGAGWLRTGWVLGAGVVVTVLATATVPALRPDGGSAATPGASSPATSPAASAPAALPPAAPLPSGSGGDGQFRHTVPHASPTPTPTAGPKHPATGCRDYDLTYLVLDAGRVLVNVTVCRGVYSGTTTLTDSAPGDGWEICAQVRGHVAGSGDSFVSTPLLATKSGGTLSFTNGPDVRFGASAHKTQDWVRVNAGRCRRSGGVLTSSWVDHDRITPG